MKSPASARALRRLDYLVIVENFHHEEKLEDCWCEDMVFQYFGIFGNILEFCLSSHSIRGGANAPFCEFVIFLKHILEFIHDPPDLLK